MWHCAMNVCYSPQSSCPGGSGAHKDLMWRGLTWQIEVRGLANRSEGLGARLAKGTSIKVRQLALTDVASYLQLLHGADDTSHLINNTMLCCISRLHLCKIFFGKIESQGSHTGTFRREGCFLLT